MESANTISSEWNKSHQSVLDDCQTQKNKNISRFFYCVQRKWVIDKSYGRFSMKSENTISNKWNDSHQSVLDNFWTQKTRIFCVFDCEMQRKWVRDKSYEDLACKVKIPSQTSGMTLTRVCWMICGHKKQQYFVFFTEKCKKKWSRDKSYGRFSMQSANTVSDEWKSSHLSVSDNLQNQNWPI